MKDNYHGFGFDSSFVQQVFDEEAFPKNFYTPAFDAVEGYDFLVVLEAVNHLVVGVFFCYIHESCDGESVSVFIYVLWSCNGVFSKVGYC